MKRLLREKATIEKMIRIYCDDHHTKKHVFCDDCFELNQYARRRIEKCKYGKKKPACKNCKTHCFQQNYREKIREVMIHSGRWMILRYPILTIQHFFDSRRYN
jgi:hypothetical protein